ncbi:ABC transporter permease subunit, partial [Candidatus Poribacteria bacterium]|nr:ABC transporter permease subunit [Candidatus Poribacteria bacterium]
MTDRDALAGSFVKRGTIGATCILLCTALMALVSLLPGFAPSNLVQSYPAPLPPSWSHPLGTGTNGYGVLRDIIARSPAYLPHGLLAVAIAVISGCALGSVAGYFSATGAVAGARNNTRWAWTDTPIRYLFGLFDSMPRLVVIVLLFAALPADTRPFYVFAGIIGLTGGMQLGGVIRSETISLRRENYIEAAVELGLRDVWIVWRHLLTTRLRPVIIGQAFQTAAEVMLVETTLRYLFPQFNAEKTWGGLLASARAYVGAPAFHPHLLKADG